MPAPSAPTPGPEGQPEPSALDSFSDASPLPPRAPEADDELPRDLVQDRCKSDPVLLELVKDFDFRPLIRHAAVRDAVVSAAEALDRGEPGRPDFLMDILQPAVTNIESSLAWSLENDARHSVLLDRDVESGIRERFASAWVLRSLDSSPTSRTSEIFLRALKAQALLGPTMFVPPFDGITEKFCSIVGNRVGDDIQSHAREIFDLWGIAPDRCAELVEACRQGAKQHDFRAALSAMKESCS